MDKRVIAKKIDSILRYLNRVQQRLPKTEADFLRDYDAQDVVVLNLTRAIQMSVDIATHLLAETNQVLPTTMAEAFTYLEGSKIIKPGTADSMRRLIGFRNIAVHSYDDLDLVITYAIALRHLDDFTNYLKEVSVFVQLEM